MRDSKQKIRVENTFLRQLMRVRIVRNEKLAFLNQIENENFEKWTDFEFMRDEYNLGHSTRFK